MSMTKTFNYSLDQDLHVIEVLRNDKKNLNDNPHARVGITELRVCRYERLCEPNSWLQGFAINE